MKNLLLTFILLISFQSLSFSQTNNTQSKSERTERKIIIKKIVTEGDEKVDEIAIQKMVDSILLTQGIEDKGNKKIKVIINKKDGSQQVDVKVDDLEKEIEIKELGGQPMRYHMIEEEQLNHEPENKAVLGLMLNEVGGNNGASISEIIEGSGAAQSNLEVGDILLKIDGKKMKNYSDVIEYLSDKEVGDVVKIKYLHNGEIESTKVKLGKRTTNSGFSKSKSCCQSKSKCYTINSNMNKDSDNSNETIVKEIQLDQLRDLENLEVIQSPDPNDSNDSDILDRDNQSSLAIEYLSSTPNPNQGQMKVNFQGKKGPTTIRLVDMNGKELFEEKIENFDGTYNKDITVTDAKGTLILYITQGKKIISEKIIVK
ncbi:MAG: PDZ domain-containing protein [Saprospiraceae bacterium]|nr:PDZ domain-containing protein [Candidatus Defluviibacterium haderslevense]